MRNQTLLLTVLLSATLAACGSGDPSAGGDGAAGELADSPAGSAEANRAAAATLPANASAEQVAAHMRGDVDCPAETPKRPAGAPVDDVVGVRPGLTYEQAAAAVMCSDPLLVVTPETYRGYRLQSYGQTVRQGFNARTAEPRVQKSGKEWMEEMNRDALARSSNARVQDMKPGQSKWYVSTMGLPGQEKVVSAAREQWFEEGRNPTVDSVAQSLVVKYGTPTGRNEQAEGYDLRWAYDPRGRPVTETSPLFNQCYGPADPDAGTNLSPDCGLVVTARIESMQSNRALAQDLKVGVVDQAGGYTALTATEQGLQAMDAARQASEVQDAASNAQAPQL